MGAYAARAGFVLLDPRMRSRVLSFDDWPLIVQFWLLAFLVFAAGLLLVWAEPRQFELREMSDREVAGFIIAWAGATAVGLFIAWAGVSTVYAALHIDARQHASVAVVGGALLAGYATVALLQWLILRQLFKRAIWWLAASVAWPLFEGLLVACAVSSWEAFAHRAPSYVATDGLYLQALPFGLATGFLQYLVLRRWLSHAWLWMFNTTLGWQAAGWVATNLVGQSGGALGHPRAAIEGWLLWAGWYALSSAVVWWLLLSYRPPNPRFAEGGHAIAQLAARLNAAKRQTQGDSMGKSV
ncbi:MAG: hypothetical protein KGJ86_05815 [Chloroflexota bacterium]|nr:hypothetical protein [Chloroflexota bacterium]